MNEYTINFSWDDEAGVWIAICDDIPLALESIRLMRQTIAFPSLRPI